MLYAFYTQVKLLYCWKDVENLQVQNCNFLACHIDSGNEVTTGVIRNTSKNATEETVSVNTLISSYGGYVGEHIT